MSNPFMMAKGPKKNLLAQALSQFSDQNNDKYNITGSTNTITRNIFATKNNQNNIKQTDTQHQKNANFITQDTMHVDNAYQQELNKPKSNSWVQNQVFHESEKQESLIYMKTPVKKIDKQKQTDSINPQTKLHNNSSPSNLMNFQPSQKPIFIEGINSNPSKSPLVFGKSNESSSNLIINPFTNATQQQSKKVEIQNPSNFSPSVKQKINQTNLLNKNSTIFKIHPDPNFNGHYTMAHVSYPLEHQQSAIEKSFSLDVRHLVLPTNQSKLCEETLKSLSKISQQQLSTYTLKNKTHPIINYFHIKSQEFNTQRIILQNEMVFEYFYGQEKDMVWTEQSKQSLDYFRKYYINDGRYTHILSHLRNKCYFMNDVVGYYILILYLKKKYPEYSFMNLFEQKHEINEQWSEIEDKEFRHFIEGKKLQMIKKLLELEMKHKLIENKQEFFYRSIFFLINYYLTYSNFYEQYQQKFQEQSNNSSRLSTFCHNFSFLSKMDQENIIFHLDNLSIDIKKCVKQSLNSLIQLVKRYYEASSVSAKDKEYILNQTIKLFGQNEDIKRFMGQQTVNQLYNLKIKHINKIKQLNWVKSDRSFKMIGQSWTTLLRYFLYTQELPQLRMYEQIYEQLKKIRYIDGNELWVEIFKNKLQQIRVRLQDNSKKKSRQSQNLTHQTQQEKEFYSFIILAQCLEKLNLSDKKGSQTNARQNQHKLINNSSKKPSLLHEQGIFDQNSTQNNNIDLKNSKNLAEKSKLSNLDPRKSYMNTKRKGKINYKQQIQKQINELVSIFLNYRPYFCKTILTIFNYFQKIRQNPTQRKQKTKNILVINQQTIMKLIRDFMHFKQRIDKNYKNDLIFQRNIKLFSIVQENYIPKGKLSFEEFQLASETILNLMIENVKKHLDKQEIQLAIENFYKFLNLCSASYHPDKISKELIELSEDQQSFFKDTKQEYDSRKKKMYIRIFNFSYDHLVKFITNYQKRFDETGFEHFVENVQKIYTILYNLNSRVSQTYCQLESEVRFILNLTETFNVTIINLLEQYYKPSPLVEIQMTQSQLLTFPKDKLRKQQKERQARHEDEKLGYQIQLITLIVSTANFLSFDLVNENLYLKSVKNASMKANIRMRLFANLFSQQQQQQSNQINQFKQFNLFKLGRSRNRMFLKKVVELFSIYYQILEQYICYKSDETTSIDQQAITKLLNVFEQLYLVYQKSELLIPIKVAIIEKKQSNFQQKTFKIINSVISLHKHYQLNHKSFQLPFSVKSLFQQILKTMLPQSLKFQKQSQVIKKPNFSELIAVQNRLYLMTKLKRRHFICKKSEEMLWQWSHQIKRLFEESYENMITTINNKVFQYCNSSSQLQIYIEFFTAFLEIYCSSRNEKSNGEQVAIKQFIQESFDLKKCPELIEYLNKHLLGLNSIEKSEVYYQQLQRHLRLIKLLQAFITFYYSLVSLQINKNEILNEIQEENHIIKRMATSFGIYLMNVPISDKHIEKIFSQDVGNPSQISLDKGSLTYEYSTILLSSFWLINKYSETIKDHSLKQYNAIFNHYQLLDSLLESIKNYTHLNQKHYSLKNKFYHLLFYFKYYINETIKQFRIKDQRNSSKKCIIYNQIYLKLENILELNTLAKRQLMSNKPDNIEESQLIQDVIQLNVQLIEISANYHKNVGQNYHSNESQYQFFDLQQIIIKFKQIYGIKNEQPQQQLYDPWGIESYKEQKQTSESIISPETLLYLEKLLIIYNPAIYSLNNKLGTNFEKIAIYYADHMDIYLSYLSSQKQLRKCDNEKEFQQKFQEYFRIIRLLPSITLVNHYDNQQQITYESNYNRIITFLQSFSKFLQTNQCYEIDLTFFINDIKNLTRKNNFYQSQQSQNQQQYQQIKQDYSSQQYFKGIFVNFELNSINKGYESQCINQSDFDDILNMSSMKFNGLIMQIFTKIFSRVNEELTFCNKYQEVLYSQFSSQDCQQKENFLSTERVLEKFCISFVMRLIIAHKKLLTITTNQAQQQFQRIKNFNSKNSLQIFPKPTMIRQFQKQIYLSCFYSLLHLIVGKSFISSDTLVKRSKLIIIKNNKSYLQYIFSSIYQQLSNRESNEKNLVKQQRKLTRLLHQLENKSLLEIFWIQITQSLQDMHISFSNPLPSSKLFQNFLQKDLGSKTYCNVKNAMRDNVVSSERDQMWQKYQNKYPFNQTNNREVSAFDMIQEIQKLQFFTSVLRLTQSIFEVLVAQELYNPHLASLKFQIKNIFKSPEKQGFGLLNLAMKQVVLIYDNIICEMQLRCKHNFSNLTAINAEEVRKYCFLKLNKSNLTKQIKTIFRGSCPLNCYLYSLLLLGNIPSKEYILSMISVILNEFEKCYNNFQFDEILKRCYYLYEKTWWIYVDRQFKIDQSEKYKKQREILQEKIEYK